MGWSIVKTLLRCSGRVLFRVKVEGDLSVFNQSGTLIVANHESSIDGILLALFLPIRPVFVVPDWDAMHPLWHRLFKLTDYLAVDLSHPMALKTIFKLLSSGRSVVMFPEARSTSTGSLMKIYDGPALIAARTGATIIPVHLEGTAHSYFGRLNCLHPRRLFPLIRISVQAATRIDVADVPNAKLRRQRAGNALRVIMQNMLLDSRPRHTLWQAYVATMALFGSRRVVIEDVRQQPMNYRTLLKLSLAIARAVARDTETGERIGVLLPNLAPTVAAIFGFTALDRVAAMINYTAGQQGMASALGVAGARVLLTSRTFLEKAGLVEFVRGLTAVKLIYLEDLRSTLTWTDKLWLVAAVYFPGLIFLEGDPEAAAVVLFTSGSEAEPKGVVLSHRALLANIEQVRTLFDIQPIDKVFNALPLFHSLGLTAGTLVPILSGMQVFLYSSPLHYRLIPELIYHKDCTILFGTSTFLGNYAKFAQPYDFYRLRYVIAGAEKLSEAVRELWAEKFGLRILEGYGVTEAAAVLAVNTPIAFKRGTVGQLLPGIAYRIIPVAGIAQGGMLWVQGPNLMTGYLCRETPGIIVPLHSLCEGGWYETGDIVERDEQGFIRILGRMKRFAKIAGEMVSLEVVERLASSASPSGQHAATVQSDVQRGEAITLYTTDAQLSRKRLQQQAEISSLSELVVPRKIIHIDAIPLLGTGKVDYLSLQQMGAAAV
ncbi:MAG: bifunctional acyl-ACP--phospholipid O-acyltransferase/long-chain-fatty-acid--ACP ligase [Sulfuriferula sp.]